MADADQELLLAVLATLTDTVPEATVADVVTRWTQDTSCSLSQMLQDQAGLDEHQLDALRRIVAAHWESCRHDFRLSLAAWNVATLPPEGETDPAAESNRLGGLLAEYLERTPPVQGSVEVEGVAGPREFPGAETDVRYQTLRAHARGGIGEVWLARDRELQREVALKKLQARYADRSDLRARFLLEAEITGKLEHPGIVPVYSMGKDPQGRPFYAMRFIKGDSLAATIQQFHENRMKAEAGAGGGGSGAVWGVEFKAILRRFLDTCETLAYAHSRGVIHRDLKPGNIMLGPYGETLVVDWGLAKIIGDVEAAQTDETEDAPDDSRPLSSSDTRPGTSIGTPSYMSPEQALGDLDRIGPKSDVYSLGATLFEILTGVAPFRGETAKQIIGAVLKAKLESPTERVPSAPPALAAVCLKAMAYEPEARYESADALARDLENWLADEPVSAYPESRLERSSRWVRRHRQLAYSAAAALVGLSLIAVIAVGLVEAARRNAVEAHREAEDNFSLAQGAVDEYLTKVSDSTLLKEEDSLDMRRLRQELLQTALRYYQNFAEERRSDPKLRRRLAAAYHRVGLIHSEIEAPSKALSALRSALAVWDELLAKAPGDAELQAGRAQTLIQIGNALARTDQPHEALRALEDAAATLEPRAEARAMPAALLMELASCYSEMSAIQAALEQDDGGLGALEKAHRVLRRLIDGTPDEPRYQRALAEIVNNQGFALFKRLEYPQALKAFEESQRICRELIERAPPGPTPIRDLELLGLSCYNIGNIYTNSREFEKALTSYEESIRHGSALVEGHPSVHRFQVDLAKSYREISIPLHDSNRDDEALDSLNRSRTLLERLVASDSQRALYHNQLGRTLNNIGYIHDEHRDNRKALGPFQESVAEHRLAVAGSVDAHDYKYFLAVTLANLGEQYNDLGDPSSGLPYFEESLQAYRELLSVNPDNDEYQAEVVNSLFAVAALRRQLGDPTHARADLESAFQILQSAVAGAVSRSELQRRRGESLIQQAGCLADQGKTDEAEPLLERAANLLRSELKSTATTTAPDPALLGALSRSLWELSRVQKLRGRAKESAQTAAERRSLWNRSNRDGLIALASQSAALVGLVGYGAGPLPPAGETVRTQYAAAAAADLQLAWELGFRDLPLLLADRPLADLLDREAFRPLRDDLAFPEHPFSIN